MSESGTVGRPGGMTLNLIRIPLVEASTMGHGQEVEVFGLVDVEPSRCPLVAVGAIGPFQLPRPKGSGSLSPRTGITAQGDGALPSYALPSQSRRERSR